MSILIMQVYSNESACRVCEWSDLCSSWANVISSLLDNDDEEENDKTVIIEAS